MLSDQERLIDHAQELASQHVSIEIIAGSQPRELTALDADQLLDLLAEEGEDTSV
jgi:hypothetical protein